MDFGSFENTIDKNIETDKTSDKFDQQLQAYKDAGNSLTSAKSGLEMATASMHEAKDKLNKNLDIKASNLAIIPTDSKGEILTYEFIGIIDEKEYLIYINAKTGEEENILLVVDNKNGKLTM